MVGATAPNDIADGKPIVARPAYVSLTESARKKSHAFDSPCVTLGRPLVRVWFEGPECAGGFLKTNRAELLPV